MVSPARAPSATLDTTMSLAARARALFPHAVQATISQRRPQRRRQLFALVVLLELGQRLLQRRAPTAQPARIPALHWQQVRPHARAVLLERGLLQLGFHWQHNARTVSLARSPQAQAQPHLLCVKAVRPVRIRPLLGQTTPPSVSTALLALPRLLLGPLSVHTAGNAWLDRGRCKARRHAQAATLDYTRLPLGQPAVSPALIATLGRTQLARRPHAPAAVLAHMDRSRLRPAAHTASLATLAHSR